jgi:hypothetical protein
MDYERAYGWKGNTIHGSETALFSECMPQCARKVLDTADIVRDAIFRSSVRRNAVTQVVVGQNESMIKSLTTVPVPDNATVRGLPSALSLAESFPDSCPVSMGLNLT